MLTALITFRVLSQTDNNIDYDQIRIIYRNAWASLLRPAFAWPRLAGLPGAGRSAGRNVAAGQWPGPQQGTGFSRNG